MLTLALTALLAADSGVAPDAGPGVARTPREAYREAERAVAREVAAQPRQELPSATPSVPIAEALESPRGTADAGRPDAGVAPAPAKKTAARDPLQDVFANGTGVAPVDPEHANLGTIGIGRVGSSPQPNPSCGATVVPYSQQLKVSAHVEVQVLSPGPRNPDEVLRLLRAKLNRFKACYERTLKRNPLVRGKLQLEVTLTTAGAATAVEILNNQTGDEELASCSKAMTRQLTGYPKAPVAGPLILGLSFWGDG